MIHRELLLASAVAVIVAAACKPESGGKAQLALRPGEVARVGDVSITSSIVAGVGRARKSQPRAALEYLVEDARLSQDGEDRGLVERDPSTRWACTAALARRALTRFQEEAAALGPPTDDELASLTVVHAVILRSTILTDEQGFAIATAIERTVRGAASADDFQARASAVPHAGARVVVERMADFGADGLLADATSLDSKFVAAAFSLHSRFETTPVVETRFGWHVMQLVDRKTPDASVVGRRRGELSEAVSALRARTQEANAIRRHGGREHVQIMGAAEALMASAAKALE